MSIPNPCLSPNSRKHWGAKIKHKQAAKINMMVALQNADLTGSNWPACRMHVVWFGRTLAVLKMDSDNAWGTLKATRDSLQLYGVVANDHTVQMGQMRFEVDKQNPRLEITLERLDA